MAIKRITHHQLLISTPFLLPPRYPFNTLLSLSLISNPSPTHPPQTPTCPQAHPKKLSRPSLEGPMWREESGIKGWGGEVMTGSRAMVVRRLSEWFCHSAGILDDGAKMKKVRLSEGAALM